MVSTRRKSYQSTTTATSDSDGHVTTRLRHNSLSDPPVAASPRRSRRASSLTPLEVGGSSAESAQARGHRTKALLERCREAAGALKVVEEETVPAAKMESGDTEVGRKTGEPAKTESSVAESVVAEETSADDPAESIKEGVEESTPEPAAQDPDPGAAQDVEETPVQVSESKGSSEVIETATKPALQKAEERDKEDPEPLEPPGSVKTATPDVADSEGTTIDEASESVKDHVTLAVDLELEEGSLEAAMEVGDEDEEVDVETVEEESADQKAAEEAARRVAAARRVLASITEVPTPVVAVEVSTPSDAVPAPLPIAATDAPALTRIRLAPKPRGMAKSGRFWKSVRTRASKVVVRDSVSYEERMKKRQKQQAVKDLENQLKNERKQKLEDLRKRREYNAKKATENALKAEVYQVVKNPNKIKRMKKKQLRLLQKRDTTVVGQSVLEK